MKLIMDICFSVPVIKPACPDAGMLDNEWPSGSECRKAIIKRLESLSDDELEEAVSFVDVEEESS